MRENLSGKKNTAVRYDYFFIHSNLACAFATVVMRNETLMRVVSERVLCQLSDPWLDSELRLIA